jgi:molybdopterin converting factor small subunit
MVVEVRLFATLRRYTPSNPSGVITVDVPEGISVLDLITNLKIDPAEVHLVMINGIGCGLGETVKSGDRIGLFPPVGGG